MILEFAYSVFVSYFILLGAFGAFYLSLVLGYGMSRLEKIALFMFGFCAIHAIAPVIIICTILKLYPENTNTTCEADKHE